MRFGVLGSGTVGQTLAGKLVELGHEVTMGARQAGSDKAVEWARAAGDDAAAKQQGADLLGDFGWPADSVLDLGGVDAARGMEMYLPLWLRMMGALGTPQFNIAAVRG
jgi:predicted dinucleotide-binding enzyme